MPNISEVSHAQLLMWVGVYFFSGLTLYGGIMWLLVRKTVRPLNAQVRNLQDEVCKIDKKRESEFTRLSGDLIKLDEKKVEVVLYTQDKEAAREIVATLQTRDACLLMQKACIGSFAPRLQTIQDDIKEVLGVVHKNEADLAAHGTAIKAVETRVSHAIERMDNHMNGHSHK